MFNDLRFRMRSLLQRDIVESELTDELRFHLELEVKKYRDAGMTHEEAMRRARMALGREEQIRDDCREASGTNLLETALQDIRYGLRSMRKHPGFFAIAALTLALGIGASTAVFSVVNAILLKPLPYPNASRVLMLWREGPLAGLGDFPWSEREFTILEQSPMAFQHLGAFERDSFNLTGVRNSELLDGVRASAGFFPALGVQPERGRVFSADEDKPGNEHVAVLSHRLWLTRFGGDKAIIGKTVHLNGLSYTVIGVMRPSFTFPNQQGIPASLDLPKEAQLWVPLGLQAAPPAGPSQLGVIAELKSDSTPAQVAQTMAAFEQRYKVASPTIKGWSSRTVPLLQQTVSDTLRPLLLLFGAVCVVLLIACANIAGLMLNRSLGRRRELTLRAAVGANRGRLARQLMTESLLLAFGGGFIGVLLAAATLFALKNFGPAGVPHLQETTLDLRVIACSMAATFFTGILFGFAPALGATSMNLIEALKEGGQRARGSASAPRIRNALVVAEVAMALVLVISAGLLVRTFYSMLHANAGFSVKRVVTFELPLPSAKYADTTRMAQLYQEVLLRLRAIPTVERAGLASAVPMGGALDGTGIRIPEHPVADASENPFVNYSFISPGYFATIGTPLLHGRDIGNADTLDSVPVTIINNAMARKYFPGEDPIGKQVGVGSTKYPVRTIIGMVADTKQASLREIPQPEMFVPYTQNEIKTWPSMQTMQFAVQTKVDEVSVVTDINNTIHAIDPDLPVANFATLATLVDTSMNADRFSLIMVASFGALGLVLAAIGMYGVLSWSVVQRTSEIGIRIALGAKRSQIVLMILRAASYLACCGVAIGLVAAFLITRLLARFLYGVQPTDPLTYAGVSLLLIFVALVACAVPAWRAMRVDPVIALRAE